MADGAWKDSVTTIQVSKATRDILRKLTVHAGEHCYEELFVKHIFPLIKKEVGSDETVEIGEWFKRRKRRKHNGAGAERPVPAGERGTEGRAGFPPAPQT